MHGHVLEMSTHTILFLPPSYKYNVHSDIQYSLTTSSFLPATQTVTLQVEGEKVRGRKNKLTVSQLTVIKLTVVAGQIWQLHIG